MTPKKHFYQKLIYVGVIAVLLLLLYWMGAPSYVKDTERNIQSPGGKLAQLRDSYGLSETKLGEIDPTGSAMKLATFGMRGVAIALLWNRSLECEKRADWEDVKTIGEQITMLEPHFITIWDFVGWNIAYNASAQYDDYRERYNWVTNGFEFLQNGTLYNKLSAKLYKTTGWTISQKIGIADEKNQYRRLFREDRDFHQRQKEKFWDSFWSRYQREFSYESRPDSWLFGRVFYLEAENIFDDPANKGSDLGNETRSVFYCRSRMNLINYARWMEIDGCGVNKTNTPVFDDLNAAGAWKNAEKYWNEFTDRKITTIIDDRQNPGKHRVTSMNELKENRKEQDRLIDELAAMLPEGVTLESIVWDRFNNELTDDQRASLYESLLNVAPEYDPVLGRNDRPLRIIRDYFDGKYGSVPEWEEWQSKLLALQRAAFDEKNRDFYDIPVLLRTSDEAEALKEDYQKLEMISLQAKELLQITGKVIAEKVSEEDQPKAQDICDQLDLLQQRAIFASYYRDIIGCDKHDSDVVIEQLPEARNARDQRYQARVLFYSGEHEKASDAFLGSMASWRQIAEKPGFEYIDYMSQYTAEFNDEIEKYTIILEQLERIFPAKFAFQKYAQDAEGDFLRLRREALQWLQKRFDEGDYETVSERSKNLMRHWRDYFTSAQEVNPLFPTQTVREDFPISFRFLVSACEKLGETKIAEERQNEWLENYPLKPQLETLIEKGEPLYEEIQKSELEVLTDPDHALDHLVKSTTDWGTLLEKYPILRYDQSSELRGQIQQTALLYLEELKKAGQEKTEDFVLESFIQE